MTDPGTRMRWVLASLVAVAAALLAGCAVLLAAGAGDGARARGHGAAQGAAHDRQAAVTRAYARLPLAFERNRGQTDHRVRFLARGAGYTMFLTPREAVLSIAAGARSRSAGAASRPAASARGAVVRLRLLGGAHSPPVDGVGRLPGVSNYLRARDHGGPHTGIPGYARVHYRDVYPGIGLVFYGRQGRLEYDFHVAREADPRAIGFGVSGARRLRLDRSGNLVISTAVGRVRQLRPVAFQRIGGRRHPVAARYVLKGRGRVGFELGRYDRGRALVIDPVLTYSTYLGGGTGSNDAVAIAADSTGAAYVAGGTSAVDFPTTSGAYDKTRGSGNTFSEDAFVTKLSPTGGALIYSTYLGGDGDDIASGIAVSSSGRAYVTGNTSSSAFPTTAGAFRKTLPNASGSAFVSVLKADGSALDYSTFLGGTTAPSSSAGVALDSSARVYVAGTTQATDLPTKAPSPSTPFQPNHAGDPTVDFNDDAFVAKLDPAASGAASLVYSTYLGGSDFDTASGVAVDAGGNAYLGGATSSTNFPTRNPLQATPGGNGDGFATKLNPTGSALANSTYLGGSDADRVAGIALDPAGRAYVAGTTASTNFPTKSAFQPGHAGNPAIDFNNDAFVTKLDPGSSGAASLIYSSYLGGAGDDTAAGIAVAPSGSAYVAGSADTINGSAVPGSFPTVDAFAPFATGGDAFVSAVKPDGSGLSFSSYLGGGGEDDVGGVVFGGGLAVDGSGNAYVAGSAGSTDFPTHNAYQPTNPGRGVNDRRQAFVAKLAPVAAAAPLVTELARRSGPGATSVVISGHGFTGASQVRFGAAAASSFTVDSDKQITATAPPGAEGPVAVTVTTSQGTSPANPITTFTYAQGTWDLTGSLRVARQAGQTATLLSNGKVLVAGGTDSSFTPTTSAEVYDPASGRWTATGLTVSARQQFTATLLRNGRVLVSGGLDENSNPLTSAELYDPASGTWTTTGSMAGERFGHTATLLSNGKVLVAGGTTASFSSTTSAELYDPATQKWSPAGSLHDARTGHTATLLEGNNVLAVGGNGASGPLASAELYDATKNRWVTTGPLGVARAGHTATTLGDGRVLVAGGASGLFSLNSAEVYDPATRDFNASSAMGQRRAGAAAAMLLDGKVLVVGGVEINSRHNTAELYDPTTGRWGSAGVMNRYRGFEFFGTEVFALTLTGGKVLVGGDSRSAGATTELYTPTAPAGPPAVGQVSAGQGVLGATVDKFAPGVSGFGLTHNPFVVGGRTPTFGVAARARRHKRGTTFRYKLSEAATVRIVIARGRTGRRKGKRCVTTTRRLHKAKKCIRILVRGTLTRTSHQGANRVAFSGRIGSRALGPGSYQATLTATDAAKNASKAKTVIFRIVTR